MIAAVLAEILTLAVLLVSLILCAQLVDGQRPERLLVSAGIAFWGCLAATQLLRVAAWVLA